MVNQGLAYKWADSLRVSAAMYCCGFVELPHFLNPAVNKVEAKPLLDLLSAPEKALNLHGLLMIGIVCSFKLQLNTLTLSPDFLHKFHSLQEEVIVSISNMGESPYDR